MSTKTTKRIINIDNGTEFAKAYTTDTVDSLISTVSNTASTAKDNVDSLSGVVSGIRSDISSVISDVNKYHADVTSLESEVSTAQNAIKETMAKAFGSTMYVAESNIIKFVSTDSKTIDKYGFIFSGFSVSQDSETGNITITNTTRSCPYTITFIDE